MASSDFTPSSAAHAMQLRTRKKHKFDEVEANLPDPSAALCQLPQQVAQLNVGGVLNKLGSLNPFGRLVTEDDIVWLFDNTAYKHSRLGSWKAEFVTAVFEREAKCRVADIVAGIASQVGLADDAVERKTIEERLMPFLWDVRAARIVNASHGDKVLKLGPTSLNGIATDTIKLSSSDRGSLVNCTAQGPSGPDAILDSQTYFAGPDGWGIISDVDDTIKITKTSDPVGILRETFVNQPRPIPNMPELYAQLQSFLPEDTPWFYLSASPYNLYPFLKDFRNQFYPPGTLILRDSSLMSISGLLSALSLGTEEYKVHRMQKINTWLPERKMIVFGDSTQSDPEAYGEIYRTIPGWIRMIFIRKATDVAELGISEKNEPERFEKAFKDVPREAWHVFEDPRECEQMIKDLVSND